MPAARYFGGVELLAATPKSIFTPPLTGATVSVSIVNKGTASAKIKLSYGTTIDVHGGSSHYLEFETVLAPKAVLERTGLTVEDGYFLTVESDVINVNATAYGIEV